MGKVANAPARARRGAWAMLVAAVLALAARPAHAQGAHFELLSGVGYSSSTDGPTLLLGAEVTSTRRVGNFFTGIQETSLGVHFSDVYAVEAQDNTLTFGVEGAWSRYRGPLSLAMKGQAFLRQRDGVIARTAGVSGTGIFGRISGQFSLDYVESDQAAFPWFQKDLDGLLNKGEVAPFYRAHLGVSASILPNSPLRWSQDVKWRRPVEEDGSFSVTTGPEYSFGASSIAAQGGLLFTTEGIEPLWQIRYQLLDSRSPVEFQLTIATQSLHGRGPTVYGWLGYAGESFGLGAALQIEQSPEGDLAPAIYFSFHPKF